MSHPVFRLFPILIIAMIWAAFIYEKRPASTSLSEIDVEKGVRIVDKPEEKRVEIYMNGSLFTAYIYPDQIAKPVLYPLITKSGKVLTRRYPLEPAAGERADHPHHVGHWFNYGNVNGLDFWNNSGKVPEEKKHRYGTIYHKRVLEAIGGDEKGVLEVETEWKTPDHDVLLRERTRFVFSEKGGTRSITRITQLTALDKKVSFSDNKEGMIAVRVAEALRLPSRKPAIYTDENGIPMKNKMINNKGVNGNYLSSEGLEGNAVWGTRARWVKLYAKMEMEPVAIVIIDHPGNPGYPTYWHARDYGLFAANPLGQQVFSKGKEALDFELPPNSSVTFKYQILIHSGEELSKEAVEKWANAFER